MKRSLTLLAAALFIAGCGDDDHAERALLEETRAMHHELHDALVRQTEILEQMRAEENQQREAQLDEIRGQMAPREELEGLRHELEELRQELDRVRESTVPREAFHDLDRRIDELFRGLTETREQLERMRRERGAAAERSTPPLPGDNTAAIAPGERHPRPDRLEPGRRGVQVP